MKAKTTSLLIILATLVIGIGIGFLLGGMFRHEQERAFAMLHSRERFERVMDRLLEPQPEQRAAVERIMTRRFEQLAGIQEEHQNEVFAIFDSLHADLATVLTAEQIASLEREIMKGGHRFAEARVERLASALELSPEQQQQIAAILERLQPPPRGERGMRRSDWHDMRRGMRSLLEQINDEIEQVLTPEQREKYRKLRKHRRFPSGGPPPEPPIP